MSETKEVPGRCAKKLWRGGMHAPCSFMGSVKEGDQWWCKMHAPSRIAEKALARKKKLTELGEASKAKWAAMGNAYLRRDKLVSAALAFLAGEEELHAKLGTVEMSPLFVAAREYREAARETERAAEFLAGVKAKYRKEKKP